jgi:hypothetical protein
MCDDEASEVYNTNICGTRFTSTGVGVRIAHLLAGSTRYFTAKQNVGRVKSSVAVVGHGSNSIHLHRKPCL